MHLAKVEVLYFLVFIDLLPLFLNHKLHEYINHMIMFVLLNIISSVCIHTQYIFLMDEYD